jgi:hypothetical protein
MTLFGLLVLVAASLAVSVRPVAAEIRSCRAKVDPKTGVIEVGATGVSGSPVWGYTASAMQFLFNNEMDCFDAGASKLKDCYLADPATDAATTPPPTCKIFVDDDSGGGPCVAFLKKNCTVLTAVPGTDERYLELLGYLQREKRVFVTSQLFSTNLGGLAGADQKCRGAAAAAGLGDSWVAWLSDSTTDALDRLASSGPWNRLDGARVADDVADLTNGALHNPIDVDESGAVGIAAPVITNTRTDGTRNPGTGATYCNDWTGVSGFGQGAFNNGNTSSTAGDWTEASTSTSPNFDCYFNFGAASFRLYCFEQ